MKVIFHVSTCDKFHIVLNHAKELLTTCFEQDESCTIEILAEGDAILAYHPADAEHLGILDDLTSMLSVGITFAACAYGVSAHNLTPAKLLPEVIVVPFGIAELIAKQNEGYAYIHI